MTCADFHDRLFDEDCRAALAGKAAVPSDVSEHAAHCADCSREWAESAIDVKRLSVQLLVSPSPTLRRQLIGAFPVKTSTRTLQLDFFVLSRVVAGGALGALCAPAAVPAWAAFGAGASIFLAIVTLHGARQRWLVPGASVCSAASRAIHLLASSI